MSLIFCKCGCGQQREEFDRWGRKRTHLSGHSGKGKSRTEETKNKISKTRIEKGISVTENNSNWKGGKPSCPVCGKKLARRGAKRCVHHRSEEHKEKLSSSHTGKYPSLETMKKMKGRIPWNKGKTFMQKENHPNWKGGISTTYNSIRSSSKYIDWRDSIFKRDEFTCQVCKNNMGGNLNAHHIKSFKIILEQNNIKSLEKALYCDELWDLKNGITLCEECHRKIRD